MLDMIKAGKQIAALRKQKKITQEELAQRLSVTPQAISKWENGHTMPEVSLLVDLARVLETSIDAILLPGESLTPRANFEYILLPYAPIADFSGQKWPRSMAVPALISALKLHLGLETHTDFQHRQINDDTEYILQAAFTSIICGYSYGRSFSELDALPTLGLTCEVCRREDLTDTELIQQARQHILNGYPVVVEPRAYADIILATGFSDHGKTLKGLPFLDGDDDKNSVMAFSQLQDFPNWYHDPISLVLIHPAAPTLTVESACRKALLDNYALLSNTEQLFDHPLHGCGLIIYDNWCGELEKEQTQNLPTLNCLYPHIFIHYESKLRIRQFLELCLPMIPSSYQAALGKAISKYAEILDLCEKAMPALLTDKPRDLHQVKNLRQSFIHTLQRSRELEAEALSSWKQVLSILS